MKTFRWQIFSEKMTTLYRPTGPIELDLIKKMKWKGFPPRLPEQPIFYPVLSEEYAIKIASDWNVRSSGSGHVLEFAIKSSFLDQYQAQSVGGISHQEYWIPAEDLNAFNNAIIGNIKKIKSYYKWYVYLLKCSDDSLYCGITNNLDKRINAHNASKGAKYTRGRTPVTLLKSFEVFSKSEALKKEHQIKKLSRDDKLKLASI